MLNPEMQLADLASPEKKAMRDGFGEALREIGGRNKKVVVLCADLTESTRTNLFKEEFPDRFLEMGISEQNMMGVAAGLALSGKIPVAASFACFNPGRNWEQMRLAVALSKTNVKVVGGHAGLGNGVDGGNQQMFEDLALTRVLPGVTVLAPADYEQIKKATVAMIEHEGPVYLRMTKPAYPTVTTRGTPFVLGQAQVLREGTAVTVIACGSMVYEALMAAEDLAKEVSIEVINVHTLKPLDRETILRSAKKTGKIVTAEEHSVIGGLGAAVAEVLGESLPVPLRRVGLLDVFGETGEIGALRQKLGLTKEAVIEAIRSLSRSGGVV